MKHYLYTVKLKHLNTEVIKVSSDVKEVYRDVMRSTSYNIKLIDFDLKPKNVSKKKFYEIMLSIDPLQAYRFVEHISTNELLLVKNRSDLGIDLKTWNAFKSVESSLI